MKRGGSSARQMAISRLLKRAGSLAPDITIPDYGIDVEAGEGITDNIVPSRSIKDEESSKSVPFASAFWKTRVG